MNNLKSDSKYLFLFFLVWPFGAFVMAARRLSHPNESIILLFSFLFGYTVFQYSGDIIDYRDSFTEILKYSWNDYWYLARNVFSVEKLLIYEPNVVNTQPDVYALTLQFLVSRFTDNPRWFWAFGSLIYTFVFLKFIKEALLEVRPVNSIAQKVFMIFFILIVPFYVGVTGIRFWTALFVFMTFTIRYIRDGKVKNILFAALSIAIHFSFIIPVLLLLLQNLFKKRILSTALILSSIAFFLLSTNDKILEVIQQNVSVFQDTSVEGRVQGYTDLELLTQKRAAAEATNWYVTLRQDSILFVLIIAFLLEFAGFIKWKSNTFLQNLYPFLVIFFCLTVLSFNLGSVGRFKNIFYLLALFRYAILFGLNFHSTSLRLLGKVLLPILILHVIVIARAGFYFVDPLLLVGNPFVLFFIHSDVSLSELIVGH